ncbi:MAG TPA: DoxX family protein [Candidatus Binataceae bacterium]|nr:DoxX family protein [Candidatus Binataceae bacterium]
MESMRGVGALLGRILLSAIFVLAGFQKIGHFAGTAGYMAHAGISASIAPALLAISIVVELGGGLLVLLGFYASAAAMIIFLWLIPVTYIFHIETGQMIQVMKNLSMMGGLLLVAANGPGGMSINRR